MYSEYLCPSRVREATRDQPNLRKISRYTYLKKKKEDKKGRKFLFYRGTKSTWKFGHGSVDLFRLGTLRT